jgi:predicted RNase H-like HicB family nuclease
MIIAIRNISENVPQLFASGVWNAGVPLANYNEGVTFRIVLEYDADAQAFSAICPELPGCASAGDTEEEAKQNIKEAIELYLAPSDVELSRDAKLDEVTVG